MAVVAVATALALTGCAAETSLDPPATATGSAAVASPSQPVQTAEPATEVTLPAGSVWTQVPGHPLQFAAPGSWATLDPAKLRGQAETDMPPEVTEMAAQLGLPPEEFIATLGQSSLLLVAAPDSAANITVAEVPGRDPPPVQHVQEALREAGATPSVARPADTPVGPAVRVRYDVDLDVDQDGGQTLRVSGQQAIVDTGEAVLQFTVTARDPQRVAAITDEVLSTLRRAR